jgi:hypothetical protein
MPALDTPSLDGDTLASVIQQVPGFSSATVANWSVTTLHPGHDATAGVYRVAGEALVGDQLLPWSLALKVLRAAGGAEAWREVHAYRSGLLRDLPGLAAPLCYAIIEREHGEAWLWLEDLGDAPPSDWSLERCTLAARHLGRFNGAYLAGRPLPDAPWLNHNLLRRMMEQRGPARLALVARPETWDNPMVRQFFPKPLAPRLLALWERHAALLDQLDRLPRTLCHHDTWTLNLFVRDGVNGAAQTVAIDWALVGLGALGEELGQFVAGSMQLVDDTVAEGLDTAAFAGYLAGLSDAGWDGDAREVRFGCLASAALRWAHVPPGLALALDPSRHARLEARAGLPIAEVLRRRARTAYALLDLVEAIFTG